MIAANAALTTLYWQVGNRVLSILDGRRAEYGAHVITELGRRLSVRHGRGFDEKSLRHTLRFAQASVPTPLLSNIGDIDDVAHAGYRVSTSRVSSSRSAVSL